MEQDFDYNAMPYFYEDDRIDSYNDWILYNQFTINYERIWAEVMSISDISKRKKRLLELKDSITLKRLEQLENNIGFEYFKGLPTKEKINIAIDIEISRIESISFENTNLKNNKDLKYKELTVNQIGIVFYYLIKHLKHSNFNRLACAELAASISSKDCGNLEKAIQKPNNVISKEYKIENLERVKKHFERLELTEIVDEINKEIEKISSNKLN